MIVSCLMPESYSLAALTASCSISLPMAEPASASTVTERENNMAKERANDQVSKTVRDREEKGGVKVKLKR